MTVLNTDNGWSVGDDVRVLVAAGLPLGNYQLDRIRQDMNQMSVDFADAIPPVLDLLDQWDEANEKMSSLNTTGEGRVLVKADVLEWSPSTPGGTYGPEREFDRIRSLLYQYFGFSMLFSSSAIPGVTPLIRS